MALYAIADLHLSTTVDKPMDVFGRRWQGYREKLERNWRGLVEDGDTVVVPGDVSWAMTLAEAEEDLRFLDSLPGKKLIGKGNHDFWWETVSKMKRFLGEIGVGSVDFLYNNAFLAEGKILCGTRGWYVEERLQQKARNDPNYEKIVAREAGRLTLCLSAAKRLREAAPEAEILVYFHFPPVFGGFVCEELIRPLVEHGIERCFFGHIHGMYTVPQTTVYRGISFTLISADFLNFIPLLTR